jgi:pimeloyl-ACP methyl ester carboxylesterase
MHGADRMLAHECHGDGPVAVALLHGVGGSRRIWADEVSGTARALAQAGFTALALDLPGYGDSALPEDLSMASMAQAVADTLQALGFEQAVLLGHSMGGMVAQEFAATWPQRVRALVLACTSPAFGRPGGDWQQAFLRDRLAPLDAGHGMAAVAARLVPAMVAPKVPEAAQEAARRIMSAVSPATYRAALGALVHFDRRAALPALRMPTLCLAAAHDRTAPPEVMQRMSAHIPGAEYVCLPDAGHIANVEQPEAFNRAVVQFLGRHFQMP